MCGACDDATHGPAGPLTRDRRLLSVGGVAATLEHRVYLEEPTPRAVQSGCEYAIRHGMPCVIVRPEFVSMASLHLAGTAVSVVTVPGWRDDVVEPLTRRALLAEARRLAAEGADDIGVVAGADQLAADQAARCAADVAALADAMRACETRVRVILDTEGLTPKVIEGACGQLGATGAWLVQGGSWRGSRTGLSRIQLMRAALPADVRLKWTSPVRSIDSMLVSIAEGVDRFNGDPAQLLKDAARRVQAGPLVVPVRGIDY